MARFLTVSRPVGPMLVRHSCRQQYLSPHLHVSALELRAARRRSQSTNMLPSPARQPVRGARLQESHDNVRHTSLVQRIASIARLCSSGLHRSILPRKHEQCSRCKPEMTATSQRRTAFSRGRIWRRATSEPLLYRGFARLEPFPRARAALGMALSTMKGKRRTG